MWSRWWYVMAPAAHVAVALLCLDGAADASGFLHAWHGRNRINRGAESERWSDVNIVRFIAGFVARPYAVRMLPRDGG